MMADLRSPAVGEALAAAASRMDTQERGSAFPRDEGGPLVGVEKVSPGSGWYKNDGSQIFAAAFPDPLVDAGGFLIHLSAARIAHRMANIERLPRIP